MTEPPEHVGSVLESLEFYANEFESVGPYVIADSKRARAALKKRLGE